MGLIHEDNIYGRPTIFVTMSSQSPDAESKVSNYKALHDEGHFNLVAIPFDHNGFEPGDDHEILTYYENVLGIHFYVTEKITSDHLFFKHFGEVTNYFTEYHFNEKTKFIGRK